MTNLQELKTQIEANTKYSATIWQKAGKHRIYLKLSDKRNFFVTAYIEAESEIELEPGDNAYSGCALKVFVADSGQPYAWVKSQQNKWFEAIKEELAELPAIKSWLETLNQ